MSVSQAPPKGRGRLIAVVGCVVVAACLCIAAAIAGYFYFRGRLGGGAQPTIEYILDASPRMNNASGGDTRIGVARGVMGEIVRTADPQLTAGLRVFGTGASTQSCQDTNLLVPLAASNQVKIEKGLGGIAPGTQPDSPLAEAMIAAIRDVAKTKGPQTIVVVTGGADSCNPESGELIRREAQRAGVELKLFVIGFDVAPAEADAIRSMVAMVPGATYQDAPDAPALRSTLATIQTDVNRQVATTSKAPPAAAQGATACDHPFLPLRSGSSWTYSTSEGSMTWNVTSASGTADSAVATMDIGFAGGNMTVHWNCSTEGLVSFDFGNLASSSLGQIATFNVVNSSGTFLPPADRLVPGYSWNNAYTIDMSFSAGGFSSNMQTTTSESWTVTGQEKVSLSTGTYDALRVDGTMTSTSSGGPIPIPSTTMNATYWYARGVGITRYHYSGTAIDITADLASYTVP